MQSIPSRSLMTALGLPSDFVRKGLLLLLRSGYVRELGQRVILLSSAVAVIFLVSQVVDAVIGG
jgi:hypothetical protein